MPVAAVNGNELHYVRRGEGEPLLLVMGMSGTHLHWGDAFMSALDDDFESVAFDHRGVGASTRLAGPITIVEMADDAAGLLDALAWDSAHVMGISMGGMIAQEIALRHPDRVRSLTLGCTYAGGPGAALAGPEVQQGLLEAMMSGDRERQLRAGYEFNVSEEYAADPEHFTPFLEIAQQIPVALEVIQAQFAAIAGHDTSARLKDISAPTLVIHGERDQMLPVQNARLIADAIPGARLEIFEGVGHLFFWERASESAQLVREHAARSRAPQGSTAAQS